MTTTFTHLPIVSLAALSNPSPSVESLATLSSRLDDVFSTTGFAYLTELPLTLSHEDVFGICERFFGSEGIGEAEKRRLLKKSFRKENKNTYRGYFPPQTGSDNYKEGFEMGSPTPLTPLHPTRFPSTKFNLTEPNIWPVSCEKDTAFKKDMKTFYTELQAMSARILSLLATALGQDSHYFDHYLPNSLSTLRLIHYPPIPMARTTPITENDQMMSTEKVQQQELICTPPTDSGILTILHQDQTGGLEVLNAAGHWIPAPYVPGSVVVNIGDLMARVSGGRWVATMHRVRAAMSSPHANTTSSGDGKVIRKGRYSVPFFFEPGAECIVRSAIPADGVEDDGVIYGEHLLKKMEGWIEFQDVDVMDEKKALMEELVEPQNISA